MVANLRLSGLIANLKNGGIDETKKPRIARLSFGKLKD